MPSDPPSVKSEAAIKALKDLGYDSLTKAEWKKLSKEKQAEIKKGIKEAEEKKKEEDAQAKARLKALIVDMTTLIRPASVKAESNAAALLDQRSLGADFDDLTDQGNTIYLSAKDTLEEATENVAEMREIQQDHPEASNVWVKKLKAADEAVEAIRGIVDAIDEIRLTLNRGAGIAETYLDVKDDFEELHKRFEAVKDVGSVARDNAQVADTEIAKNLKAADTEFGDGKWNDGNCERKVIELGLQVHNFETKVLLAEQAKLDSQKPESLLKTARMKARTKFSENTFGAPTSQSDYNVKVETFFKLLKQSNPEYQQSDLAPVFAPLDKIRNQFSADIDKLQTVKEVEDAVDPAIQKFAQELARIQQSDEIITISKAALDKRKLTDSCAAAMLLVTKALDALRLTGSPKLKELTAEYQAAIKNVDVMTKEQYQALIDTTLPALKTKIDQETESTIQSSDALFVTQRKELEKAKQTLKEATSKKAKPALSDAMKKALREAVNANLALANTLLNGPDSANHNADAANTAARLIVEALGYITDAQQPTGKFKDITDKLEQVKTLLEDAEFKLAPDAVKTEITKKYKEVKGAGPGADLEAYLKTVTELFTDADEAKKLGHEIKEWHTDGKKKIKILKGKYSGFEKDFIKNFTAKFGTENITPPKGLIFKDYSGALKGDLAALEKGLSATVTSETLTKTKASWTTQHDSILEKLDKIWDGKAIPDTGKPLVVEDVKKQMTSDSDIKKAQERLKTVRKAVNKYGKDCRKIKADTDEYKLMSRQLDGLKDLIKTDVAGANTQMNQITERLNNLPGSPTFKKKYRKNLKDTAAQWAVGIKALHDGVDRLADAIEGSAKGEPPFETEVSGIKAQLTPVLQLFKADAFTECIDIMTNDDTTDTDKRQAREVALKTVNLYYDRMSSHALANKLALNPFGVDMFGNMYQQLQAIELEVTRYAI